MLYYVLLDYTILDYTILHYTTLHHTPLLNGSCVVVAWLRTVGMAGSPWQLGPLPLTTRAMEFIIVYAYILYTYICMYIIYYLCTYVYV